MLSGQRRRFCDQLCQASQVLGDGRKYKLVLRATRATQTKTAEPQDALQVREPHLYAFAVVSRLLEGFGTGERSSDVAGALVDAAGNLADRCLWTASGFEWARGAVSRAAAIEKRGAVVYERATGRQGLPGRADIGVGALVVTELVTLEGPVFSFGLIDDGDVRRDLLLLDQPV